MPPSRTYLWLSSIFDVSKYILLFVIIIAVFFVFVGVPLLVQGDSMVPTFNSHDIVLVEQISYRGKHEIQRGDIVAARFPADPEKIRLIKRVVGIPGDTIRAQNGLIYLNDRLLIEGYTVPGAAPAETEEPITLDDNQYYLLGDNRPGSSDSRLWGPVLRSDIQGKVSVQLWPLGKVRFLDPVSYLHGGG